MRSSLSKRKKRRKEKQFCAGFPHVVLLLAFLLFLSGRIEAVLLLGGADMAGEAEGDALVWALLKSC